MDDNYTDISKFINDLDKGVSDAIKGISQDMTQGVELRSNEQEAKVDYATIKAEDKIIIDEKKSQEIEMKQEEVLNEFLNMMERDAFKNF